MTPEDLKLIIAEGEGLSVEFKEKYTPKIDRDLVAFANTKGGRILLGVKDDGTLVGEKLTNRLKAEIQTLARQCDPPLDIHQLIQMGQVVVVEVMPGEEKPYSCASGYFRRMDAMTQKMNRRELALHFQTAGKDPFEDRFDADVSWKQISSKKVAAFFTEAGVRSMGARPPTVLASLNLADGNRIRNGGTLLFGRDPQRTFPQCQATFVVFKGKERRDVFDRKDVKEDLLTQFNEALFFLKKHLNTRSEIRGDRRFDLLEIPIEVLREAMANAIVHRDYGVRGTSLMVEIYDDRVEIVNPGRVPDGLTPEKLMGVSIRRNEKIADVFARMQKVERLGSGLRRMRDRMRSVRLPSPRIHTGPFFRLSLQRPPRPGEGMNEGINEGMNEGINGVLSMIVRQPGLRAPQLAKALDTSPKNVERWLGQLKARNKIVHKGSRRTGGYWAVP
jgi:ATP-dependent DNA helicase RecG